MIEKEKAKMDEVAFEGKKNKRFIFSELLDLMR